MQQKITTLTAQVSRFKYDTAFNPQWTSLISQNDFELIVTRLNIAAKKGPIPGLKIVFFACIIVSLIILGIIVYVNSNYWFVGHSLITLSLFTITLYRFFKLRIVDKELRITVGQLNATLGTKNLWLEYHKAVQSSCLITSFSYNVHIYRVTPDEGQVIDMTGLQSQEKVNVSMTPEMQGQFSAFLQQPAQDLKTRQMVNILEMERLKITTLTCRASSMKYDAAYNPQWARYISQQDFALIMTQLNIAAEKGPSGGVLMFFYALLILGFLGFVGGIISAASTKSANVPVTVFPAFILIFIGIVCVSVYKHTTLRAVDNELRKTTNQLSTQLGPKNLLVEYNRNLYAIKVTVNNNSAHTENKYDYDVNIYYLQESVQQPQIVLDINSILPLLQQQNSANLQNQQAYANMTPEMQSQFSAFLAQQQQQVPPPYKNP
ncbi:hypothetical protein HDV01_000505 [Terramyces sp. JEL0728]|nr:hypothetical protein HDV01_000505 [Terramyces sp. JEL0728]